MSEVPLYTFLASSCRVVGAGCLGPKLQALTLNPKTLNPDR